MIGPEGLPALRTELEARGYRKVALTYFGTAPPAAYGLRSIPYSAGDDPVANGCDYLAISATHMSGVYVDASPFHGLLALPKHLAGYSIFFWELKDPRVRGIVDSARGRPYLLEPASSPRD